MADRSTLRPDASKPASSTKAEAWATGDASGQHSLAGTTAADFGDLAAKFSASDGAGLSSELAANLALEVVLNEIVNQACLATRATGAAVALRQNRELVCRASCGSTTLELGSRLEPAAGLTGACMQTGLIQLCEDAQADPRADLEACWLMGVRSVMVMPILRNGEALGVFELFSSRPSAFGERDQVTVGVLVRRVLENMEKAMKPPAPVESALVLKPVETESSTASGSSQTFEHPISYQSAARKPEPPSVGPASETAPRRGTAISWAFTVVVVACAMLLGLLIAQRLRSGRTLASAMAEARAYPRADTSATSTAAPPDKPAAPRSASSSPRTPSLRTNTTVPEGSLLVYDNGKEIFRMTPSSQPAPATGMERASSVERDRPLPLSPSAAEDDVLYRVEPQYPEEARQQQIQGTVALDVRISREGTVQNVQVISGQPILVQAATEAVKQWRFKPRTVNGLGVEMQTTVTLNFRLPH